MTSRGNPGASRKAALLVRIDVSFNELLELRFQLFRFDVSRQFRI
jgi:hypothetical protein